MNYWKLELRKEGQVPYDDSTGHIGTTAEVLKHYIILCILCIGNAGWKRKLATLPHLGLGKKSQNLRYYSNIMYSFVADSLAKQWWEEVTIRQDKKYCCRDGELLCRRLQDLTISFCVIVWRLQITASFRVYK